MLQPAISISESTSRYGREATALRTGVFGDAFDSSRGGLFDGVRRRWRRERRRRKVGRAYDMALEIARYLPANSRVLDVGCGNGFIAHHLSSLVGTRVIGIDLDATSQANIDYRRFDGVHFPVVNETVDAILLCYVLHHAQDVGAVMTEMNRVLSTGGLAVVYEDMPGTPWDRLLCGLHNLKWRKRTGPCTFFTNAGWRKQFNSAGFEIIRERGLSRWRNLTHPVSRRLFVLRKKSRPTELVPSLELAVIPV